MAAASSTGKLRHRDRKPGIQLDCGAGPDVPHHGIVFVHGIGSQAAGETLLDWGGAIVRVLLDARVRHHRSADPVIDVQLDPGPQENRYIEVQLPEVRTADGTAIPEQHWVMTEAWWAKRVRPPSFAQMADWLGTGGAITRIVDAFLKRRHGSDDPRLRRALEVRPLRRVADRIEEAPAADAGADPVEERVGNSPLARAGRKAASVGGNLYLRALSALLLVVYGLLRAIEKLLPIGPLKDGALTRPLDGFVIDWFGDVYVLLGDSAQAASVRGRLVDALRDLELAACDQIAIVAHSGGAIVSYMTLTDETRKLRVDRLITLGEGLNLAWRLTDGKGPDQAAVESERLTRNLFANHPNLKWDDFWASQDPAPVGVLGFSRGHLPDARDVARVMSHSTWNRLAFLDDHGGYWDNDEEFVIPLLRLLESRPGGSSTAPAPSLFGDPALDAVRSNKRRRRLSLLSLLRQACLVAPMAGVIAAFSIGSQTVFHLADVVARAWNWIPGTGLASDVLDSIRAQHPEDQQIVRFVAETGVWVVAAILAGTAAFSLLAPPERPMPWRHGGFLSDTLWLILRLGPWLVGLPVAGLVVYGASRFLSGSTISAMDVGYKLMVGAGVGSVLVVGLALVAGLRAGRATGLGYVANVALMAAFMVLVFALVAAPVVAAVVFEDVGRMVVGTLGAVVAFQGIARLGVWRWDVWDTRERSAARTDRPYGGRGRILGQVGLLAVIVVAALGALVFDALPAAGVAGVALVTLVLVGVAIDVLDAVREERDSPPDSIRRFQRSL